MGKALEVGKIVGDENNLWSDRYNGPRGRPTNGLPVSNRRLSLVALGQLKREKQDG